MISNDKPVPGSVPLESVIYALRERLPCFVIYDHPSDFPDTFIARMWLSLPTNIPTTIALCHTDLDVLRRGMEQLGLVQLTRSPGDDADIIETWL